MTPEEMGRRGWSVIDLREQAHNPMTSWEREALAIVNSLTEERDNLRDRVNEAGVTIIELRGQQGILTEELASLVALLEEFADPTRCVERVRALKNGRPAPAVCGECFPCRARVLLSSFTQSGTESQ